VTRAMTVLVADELSAALTVTLFAATIVKRSMSETKSLGFLFAEIDILLAHVFGKRLLVFAQLRSDVFETGQCFDAAQTVMLCDSLLQIGSDKCFDDHGARCVFLVEDALIKQRLGTIVGKERADLI